MKLGALIDQTDLHQPGRHSIGFPSPMGAEQEQLPWPRFLVIVSRPDGVFLERFTSSAEDAGDTWHQSIEEAKEQAEDEYSGLLSHWIDVPENTPDDHILNLLQADLLGFD